MRQNPPNARFWVYIAGRGPVKLTLKPGQVLHHYWGEKHEEGWSSELQRWEHLGDRVGRQTTDDGRDCDGRLTRHWHCECPLDRLRDFLPVPPYQNFHEGEPIRLPTWDQTESTQRDEYAEAMGY